MRERLTIGISLAAVIALFLPQAGTLPLAGQRSVILVTWLIAVWVIGYLPSHVAATMFLLGVNVLRLTPPETAFRGFTSQAFWLTFGGLIIGEAALRTGLARQAATWIIRMTGGRYRLMVLNLGFFGFLLAFVVPSGPGRVGVLAPIVIALAEARGFTPLSPGGAGLMLTATLCTTLPTMAIMTSAQPSVLLVGGIEAVYGYTFPYARWLGMVMPVFGVGTLLAIFLLMLRYDPDGEGGGRLPDLRAGDWTPEQKRTLLYLSIGFLFWFTDFLHGIAPAWVAMGVAVLMLAPRIGVMEAEVARRGLDLGTLFLVGTVVSMTAVLQGTGVTTWLVAELEPLTASIAGAPLKAVAGLLAGSAVLATLIGSAAAVVTVVPFVGPLAEASGLPFETAAILPILTIGNPILPFQVAPMVFALGYGWFSRGMLIRSLFYVFVMQILVTVPLTLLMWRLFGWL